MKKQVCFLILLLAGIGCREEAVLFDRTVQHFSAELTSESTYPTMVKKFGKPDLDRGSGIHIYVYRLSDSTEIWIGLSEHIMYMLHVDGQGQVIQQLI